MSQESLTAHQIGLDRDLQLDRRSAYSLVGGPIVANPLDAKPEELAEPVCILYKTEDHGKSWRRVGRFTLQHQDYSLSWEDCQIAPRAHTAPSTLRKLNP